MLLNECLRHTTTHCNTYSTTRKHTQHSHKHTFFDLLPTLTLTFKLRFTLTLTPTQTLSLSHTHTHTNTHAHTLSHTHTSSVLYRADTTAPSNCLTQKVASNFVLRVSIGTTLQRTATHCNALQPCFTRKPHSPLYQESPSRERHLKLHLRYIRMSHGTHK